MIGKTMCEVPFFLVLINDQQYSRIKLMNKYNIDFFLTRGVGVF
jgi:hypothetical protein